ncbi:MAG: MBL fold metallo-hydrolase [Firmicutes bacterium]|nr:MBL fold metallo-hydrolase [Bacillota bacterium]MDD4264262.1 MBL fold metallo-hydrolase [Bacillota bacterium]MDD4693793.1 MBL fold metallo-hydrolase [Bacillota bacterium]
MLASGSRGNSLFIEACGRSILIDIGISMRELNKRASSVGIDILSVTDCFITHEHTDHVRGIKTFAKHTSSNIWASKETLSSNPGVKNTSDLTPNEPIFVGEVKVTPISTYHDAVNPLGFVVENESSKVLILTDTGKRPKDLDRYLDNLDMVVLEANHNVRMLENGPYPYPLKKRISSQLGHLCNEDSGEILADIVNRSKNPPACFLAHLSEENNKPQVALLDVANTLKSKGVLPGKDVQLEIASQHIPSKIVAF